MQVSPSLQVIWELAATIAISKEYREIEPEHFLEAIVKITEIPEFQLSELLRDERLTRIIKGELEAVCEVFFQYGINRKSLQNEIVNLSGKGTHKYEGGQLHRSADSKSVFERATELAKKDNEVHLSHLFKAILTSDTVMIRKMLNQANITIPKYEKDKEPFKTIEYMAQPESETNEREIEARALLDIINFRRKPGIWMVCADESVAESVMQALASVNKQENRSLKITSLSAVKNDGETESIEKIEELLKEADANPGWVLFLHNMELPPVNQAGSDIVETVKQFINSSNNRNCLVVPIRPSALKQFRETDQTWRRCFQTVWTREKITREIPACI